MVAQAKSLWGRTTAAVRQFSLPQRTLAVLAVAVLALGIFALVSWTSRPTMSPLFTSLSATDASAVVDQLDAQGVPYQLADGGSTVLVPADQLYPMRLKLAAAGLPANADGEGYSLLDDMSVTSSEFQQETTYERAIEGELAKTIASIQGVEAATVKLALPQDTVFVSETADPTASVFVRTAAGVSLTTEQVQAIVHLVSAGIEGMTATDVAVIDSTGRVLSAVGTGVTGGTSGQQAGDYELRVQSAVQSLLDQVVGPGKSAVTVTAELNYDQTQRTSEEFSATPDTPPLASSKTSEQYTGGAAGGTATGVLGPDNIQVPSGTETAGSYLNTTESVNNAVNKVTEVTTTAPGSVSKQSIAVAVDSKAAAGLDMPGLTAMLAAAAGIDTARGDTIAVQQMAFDTSTATQAQEALAAADLTAQKQATAALIQKAVIGGAILLVVILVLIALGRRSRRSRRESLDIGELPLMGSGAEPPALEDGLDALPALGGGDEPLPASDSIQVKRAEIGALAQDQPGEVADLLRGWLGASAGSRR
ncbi:flagellar basal-body MS-ring/collar protein FliF [Cellulomonas hominis]